MNNKKHLKHYLIISFVAVGLFACVPAKQLEDLQKKDKNCQDDNSKLKDENHSLQTENTELKGSNSELKKATSKLASDTTEMGINYQRQASLYNSLTKSYDQLLANNEKLLSGNSEETKKLILQLSATREDLQRRDDQLKKDSIALRDREKKMNELNEDLTAKQARVDELEAIIKTVDSTANSLKSAVSKALLGYENNGLTVIQKEGRVYVSMEEQLLFASGSTQIEKNGEKALKDLSNVLANNKSINIMVEGHTDNIPISGTLPSGAKDNWELSVLRATSVAKIILNNNSIEPSRITASGRGPFKPIDTANTSDARKKNRRTEIILTPKLDDLTKLLNQIGK